MPTAKKEADVAELKELVERSTIVIGAEYRGLSVREMMALRRALRDAGVDVRVVKNRLFQLAATQAGRADIGKVVEGPTVVVFGYGDVVAPAKAIADYVKAARNAFAPKKAYLDGAILDAAAITELANLPSREQLIARLAAAFVSPVQNLVNLLTATLRDTAGLLEERAKQLEGEGSAA